MVGFSRAVRIGNVIAVSGTGPIGPDGETVGPGDIAAQTRRCWEISLLALEELGGSMDDVIRTRTFLKRREDWEVSGLVAHELASLGAHVVLVGRKVDKLERVAGEIDDIVMETAGLYYAVTAPAIASTMSSLATSLRRKDDSQAAKQASAPSK